jgi:hypothetical protein
LDTNFTISKYRCCIIDVRVFIRLEIILTTGDKIQVEIRSHFSGKQCVLWAGKYDKPSIITILQFRAFE